MPLEQSLIIHLAGQAIIAAEADGDLDPYLITAICAVESSFDQNATRYEPNYQYTIPAATLPDGARPGNCTRTTENNSQCCSYGLMQIMGATARELGFKGWLSQLFCADEGLLWGVKYLHKQWRRYYGTNGLHGVIAAYNAGSPRTHKSGAFENQIYVDKVVRKYESLLNEDKGD